MEMGDFGFLTGGVVMKKSTVPGGDADRFNGKIVGGGAWESLRRRV